MINETRLKVVEAFDWSLLPKELLWSIFPLLPIDELLLVSAHGLLKVYLALLESLSIGGYARILWALKIILSALLQLYQMRLSDGAFAGWRLSHVFLAFYWYHRFVHKLHFASDWIVFTVFAAFSQRFKAICHPHSLSLPTVAFDHLVWP